MEPTRITIDEAKERTDRGEPLVFVDARNAEAWGSATVKLPGAVRVPADDVESHVDEIAHDRSIVVYCTCPHEVSSASVAQQLLDQGFKNVHALYGGFDAWHKAGYPVEPKESRSRSSRSAGDR